MGRWKLFLLDVNTRVCKISVYVTNGCRNTTNHAEKKFSRKTGCLWVSEGVGNHKQQHCSNVTNQNQFNNSNRRRWIIKRTEQDTSTNSTLRRLYRQLPAQQFNPSSSLSELNSPCAPAPDIIDTPATPVLLSQIVDMPTELVTALPADAAFSIVDAPDNTTQSTQEFQPSKVLFVMCNKKRWNNGCNSICGKQFV